MKTKQIYTYCMWGAFFVCAVVNATQGAMLTSFIDQYGLQSSAQGATGSAQSFGQAFSLFFLLSQAGRIAKPVIVTFAFICIVIILFAISLMPPFVLLVLFYGLFGVMFGATNSTTSSLIADLYTGEDTPKKMSSLHGAYGFGGLVAPLFLVGLLNAGLYWNISVRVAAVVTAVLLVPFLFLSRYALKSIELPKSSNQKITRDDFKSFIKRGSNILLFFGVLSYGMHQSVIVVWLIRYVSVFLNTPSLGAWSLSLFWAGITISRLFIHKLLPVSPIKVVLVGNLVAMAALFAGILSGSAAVLAGCVFIAGLSNGTSVPVMLAVGCADNQGNTALPTNFLNLALFLAFALCPLIVGALVSYTSMSSGMYLSAFSTLVCAVVVWFYRRRRSMEK